MLLVRAGHAEREAGQQAVRQLHAVGARIVGAVLNDPDGELPKYSSYYSYQTGFAAISAGENHTCGLSGFVALCWGANNAGQVGDGTMTDRLTPVSVTGGLSFSAITTGGSHTCGLEDGTGSAFCWGENTVGQVGDGTTTNRDAPTAVDGGIAFDGIDGGFFHTCGRAGGIGYCWGRNFTGQLGDGTFENRLVPVFVASTR